MLRATETQGGFIWSVEGGAVIAGGVRVLACDAKDVDSGWRESVEDEGAEGVGNSLLTVEVLA